MTYLVLHWTLVGPLAFVRLFLWWVSQHHLHLHPVHNLPMQGCHGLVGVLPVCILHITHIPPRYQVHLNQRSKTAAKREKEGWGWGWGTQDLNLMCKSFIKSPTT